MNHWTAPALRPPEIDLLVRRWGLPEAREAELRRLLSAQDEGGTACALSDDAATGSADWGAALSRAGEGAARGKGGELGESGMGAGGGSGADGGAGGGEGADAAGGERGGVRGGQPVTPTPLVLSWQDGIAYLQSWRFFDAERVIARELVRRATRRAPELPEPVADLLARLGEDPLNAHQQRAIACALEHTLALITGGPGTGKTHTLARLLALLLDAQPAAPPVILLAAPTGKAADRMREAIEAAAARLPAGLSGATRARLREAAAGARTLHGLLGFNPGTGRCVYHAGHPLPCDVLIVDEGSMVDTLLWRALLVALPPAARLVLLGDPHQLESVAGGDVLGALVRKARAWPASALGRVWVELVESQRFKHRVAIGRLAEAVVALRAEEAVALLASHRLGAAAAEVGQGLGWLGEHGGRFAWGALPVVVREALAVVAEAEEPAQALEALSRVRVLTAHREFGLGAAGLNTAIGQQLAARAQPGRTVNAPIIINRNDAETGLKNGSVGVIMERAGRRWAYFPASRVDEAPQELAVGQLPEYSPAWALTIHRSQGSEFDHVVVVLPGEESPLATRELIYTAITRAREGVYVWGALATVRAALGNHAQRCTLLEVRIQEQSQHVNAEPRAAPSVAGAHEGEAVG